MEEEKQRTIDGKTGFDYLILWWKRQKNEITTSEARATPETVSRCLEASLRVFMTLFSSRFERLFFFSLRFLSPSPPDITNHDSLVPSSEVKMFSFTTSTGKCSVSSRASAEVFVTLSLRLYLSSSSSFIRKKTFPITSSESQNTFHHQSFTIGSSPFSPPLTFISSLDSPKESKTQKRKVMTWSTLKMYFDVWLLKILLLHSVSGAKCRAKREREKHRQSEISALFEGFKIHLQ